MVLDDMVVPTERIPDERVRAIVAGIKSPSYISSCLTSRGPRHSGFSELGIGRQYRCYSPNPCEIAVRNGDGHSYCGYWQK